MTGPVASGESKKLLESSVAAVSSPRSPLSVSRPPSTSQNSISVSSMESLKSAALASGAIPVMSADGRGDKSAGRVSVSPASSPGASLASPKSNSVFLSLHVSSTSSASTAIPQDECDSTASREGGSPRTPSALDGSGTTPKSASRGKPEDLSQASSSGETPSPARRGRAAPQLAGRSEDEAERKKGVDEEGVSCGTVPGSAQKRDERDVAPSLDGTHSDSEEPESPSFAKETSAINAVSGGRAERSSRKAAMRRIRQLVGVSGKDPSEDAVANLTLTDASGNATALGGGEFTSFGTGVDLVKSDEQPRKRRARTDGPSSAGDSGSRATLADGDEETSRRGFGSQTALAGAKQELHENAEVSSALAKSYAGQGTERNRTTPSAPGDADLQPAVDFARGLAAVAAEMASAQAALGRPAGEDSERSRLLSLASALGKDEPREGQFAGDNGAAPEAKGANPVVSTPELGTGFPMAADLLEEGRRLLSSPAGLSVWLECAKNASSLPKRPNEALPPELVALSASLMNDEASHGAPTPRALPVAGSPAFSEHDESPAHHLHGNALDAAFGLPLGPGEGLAPRGPLGLHANGAFGCGEKGGRQKGAKACQKSGDRAQASRPHALSRSLINSAPCSTGATPSNYGGSQHLLSNSSSMTSVMVKSVSPAGVVRRGGRNRRKRTKYDLAYRQMEQLGPFAEEAKHVDLSKVSGSSFAVELLKNPHLYSYDSWVHGFAWPVGADGRRLLLRKLRGVYWSDPDYWQKRLTAEGLYRRDLFTLATVQELFKVTHLMGADVWDFLLKCTALTHKCDALTAKEGGQSDTEEAVHNASSPEAASPHAGPEVTSQVLSQAANFAPQTDGGFPWHAMAPQAGVTTSDMLLASAVAQEECDKDQPSVGDPGENLSSVYPPPFHHSASMELGDTAAPPSPFSGPRLSTGGAISSFESSAERICAALSLRRPSSGGDREQGLEGEEERQTPAAAAWLGAEALHELLAGSLSRQERENGELTQDENVQSSAGCESLFLPPEVLGPGSALDRDRVNGVSGQEKRSRGRPRKTRQNLPSLVALREELGLHDLAQKPAGGADAGFCLPGSGLGYAEAAGDRGGNELLMPNHLAASAGATPQGYPQFNGHSPTAASALNLLKPEGFSVFGAGAAEGGPADLSGHGRDELNFKGVGDELLSSRFLVGEGNLQQALTSSLAAQGAKRGRGDAAALDLSSSLGQAPKRSRLLGAGGAQDTGAGQLSELSRLLEEELDATNSQGQETMDSLRSLMLQVAEAAVAADIGPSLSPSAHLALAERGAQNVPEGDAGDAREPAGAEPPRRRSSAGLPVDLDVLAPAAQAEGGKEAPLGRETGAGEAGWRRKNPAGAGAMEEEMRQIEILLKALDHHLADQVNSEERKMEGGAGRRSDEGSRDATLESVSVLPSMMHLVARGAAEPQLASGDFAAAGSSAGQESEANDDVAAGVGHSQENREDRSGEAGAVAEAKALLQCVSALSGPSSGSLLSAAAAGGLGEEGFPRATLASMRATGAGAGEASEAGHDGPQTRDFFPKQELGRKSSDPLRAPGRSTALKLPNVLSGQHPNAAVAAAAASSAAMAGSLLWGGDSVCRGDRCGASDAVWGADEEARLSALSFLGTLPGLTPGVGNKDRGAKPQMGNGNGRQFACGGAAMLASALFPSEASQQERLSRARRLEALDRVNGGEAPERRSSNGGSSRSSLLEALSADTHALLQLSAHYSFMAQFMQCAMLFEVQQALLRVVASMRAQERGERKTKQLWEDAQREKEGPGTDPTMKACLQSLLESGAVHMQFVQLMAQQLRRHVLSDGEEDRAVGSRSGDTDRHVDEGCGVRGRDEREDAKEARGSDAEEHLGLDKQSAFAEVSFEDFVAERTSADGPMGEETGRHRAAGEDASRQGSEEKSGRECSSGGREADVGETKEETDVAEGNVEDEVERESEAGTAGSAGRRETGAEGAKPATEEEKELRETTDEDTAKQDE